MIYLIIPLYDFGKFFIEKYNLKKDLSFHEFQIFKNEKIVLIISGNGKTKNIIASTYLFLNFKVKKEDVVIHIGMAKSDLFKTGTVILCNKITDADMEIDFYPDILLKSNFKEENITTLSKIITNNRNDFEIIDLESSGIFEASMYFIQPHQIIFLKIINLDVSDDFSQSYIEIANWINSLDLSFLKEEIVFTIIEEELIEKLFVNLKFSVAMSIELRQIFLYSKLSGKDVISIIKKFEEIKCRNKTESKKVFADIKKEMLGNI